MSDLIVRDLEDELRDKLQDLARKQGRSLEETVHDILRQGVESQPEPKEGLGTRIAQRFAACGGLDSEIQEWRGYSIEPPSFDQ